MQLQIFKPNLVTMYFLFWKNTPSLNNNPYIIYTRRAVFILFAQMKKEGFQHKILSIVQF